MASAFDAQDAIGVAGSIAQIKDEGYEAVGLYYFRSSEYKTLLTKSVAQTVSAAGLFIISIYENGLPIQPSYFTIDTANLDAHTAGVRALDAGQPDGTPIYFAVDYDAKTVDLAAITAYFTEVRRVLERLDPAYTAGVYGSGMVCQHLSELGLVSHTWLSQSTGFRGYDEWKPSAQIVQGPETTLLGLDVDLDETNGDAGGWSLAPVADGTS